jgi:hypothetical protein
LPATFTVTLSPAHVDVKANVKVTDAVSPITLLAEAALKVMLVPPVTAALEGDTARTPKPKEAITASEIRLKYVFVDIYFLSVVVLKTISSTAGEANFALCCTARATAPHSSTCIRTR